LADPIRSLFRGGATRRCAAALLWTAALLASTPAAHAQPTIFDPGSQLLHGSSAEADLYLGEIHDIGGDIVRLRPSWDDPDFPQLDYLVQGAQARGMRVLLTPMAPTAPINVTPSGTITQGPQPIGPTVAQYASFVGDLGRRYPTVHLWSIWNEPDVTQVFPLPKDAGSVPGRAYRKVFLAAQSALVTSGHQPTEVLIGETDPGPTIPFLRDVFCLNRKWERRPGCAPIDAAGWAQHPYILGRWPWYPTERYMGTADLPKLNRALRRVAAAGATRGKLPIYVTEFGVRGNDAVSAFRLSAAEWVMTHHRWVKSFAQYTLRDDWWGAGLLATDGSPKTTLSAFTHSLFVIHRGSEAVVWGHMRAWSGRTSVWLIDRGRVGSRIPVTTDSNGYFRLVTPWRKGRHWCVPGGVAVRSFNLKSQKVVIETGPAKVAPYLQPSPPTPASPALIC
jgi:hypothetical protein